MPHLRAPGWVPAVRDALERALDASLRNGPSLALFDFDNTLIRGDVGDLTLAHALEIEALRGLAEEVPVPMLEARSGALGPREIARLVWADGAFGHAHTRWYRASYGLLAIALAELEGQLAELARDAFARALTRPIGARTEVCGVEVERFARPHDALIELLHALEARGIACWIVSASPQVIVEAIARELDLDPGRVIGVRVGRGGDFAPCGAVRERDGAPVIPWLEGKRAWANEIILGRASHDARLPVLLAAGDSHGDLAILDDARVRLVIDRGDPVLLPRARAEGWAIQPPFLDPAGRGPVDDERGS